MPFNGTGTYTPAAAPNFPAVAGAVINSVYYNAVINDLATAMSNALTRDSQGKPATAMDWNNQQINNISRVGIGVVAPAYPLDIMVTGTVIGQAFSSSATTAEFWWGSATIKGMLGADFAGTIVYVGTATNHSYSIRTNGVERMRITNAGVIQDANGLEFGFKTIPRVTTATTAALSDKGKVNAISAGLTIPNATFAAGDSFSIYNDTAGALTITQGAGLTLRLGGTANTGNRTLGLRGLCTVWFNTASEAIIQGSGVS